MAVVANAADERQVERMVSEAVDELGGLEGLVINVGVARGVGFSGTSSEDCDQAFAINVRSHFLGCCLTRTQKRRARDSMGDIKEAQLTLGARCRVQQGR